MPDRLTIQGVLPYDGSYDLDLDGQPLTTREWGWIKKHAGYLPLTLTADGWADPELVAVLAIIALRRAGVIENTDVPQLVDRLADVPFGTTITIEADQQEPDGDAGPPPQSSASRPSSNGDSSPTGSETSEPTPTATGHRRSDTSESTLATSAT